MTDSAEDLTDYEVALSLDDLKSKGRKALRSSKRIGKEAAEAVSRADSLNRAGRDLLRQSFQVEGRAFKFQADGDSDAAAEQRRIRDRLREQAQQNFRVADRSGVEAGELERKAYKLRTIANTIVEQLRDLEGA